MKKVVTLACLAAAVSLATGTALADNIKGRLGLTGRVGFIVPADNDAEFGIGRKNKTDTGLTGGGGLIYGINDFLSAGIEANRSAFGSTTGDFGVTNLSLGAQYRFTLPRNRELLPYAGAGLDVIVTDYEPYDGTSRDVDTTLGVHLSGGVDYFITRDLALTAEGKILLAPDADIRNQGVRSGDFDPTGFSSTAGVRYFFN